MAEVPSRARPWLVALLLILPAAWPTVCHLRAARERKEQPTGFILYDMASYMAEAREHFDGGFKPFYGLPFSPEENTPRLYFQPQIFFLGFLHKISGWPPGAVFALFGFMAALVCGRVAVGLYDSLAPPASSSVGRAMGLTAFFWGGGVAALAGGVYAFVRGTDSGSWASDLFWFDPGEGYWFMSFGRNLILPMEAYTHALFFAAIWASLTRRWGTGLVCAAILSASHPFSGIELLLVLSAWAFAERWIFCRSEAPGWFVGGLALLTAAHLGYYLFLLGTSADHRSLVEQWSVPFLIRPAESLAAYALVAGAAFWSVRVGGFSWSSRERLLLLWAAVALALSHHDLFMKPLQPAHFTRGYVWTPLFLLGLRTWSRLWGLHSVRAKALAAAVLGVLLLDNVLWLATYDRRAVGSAPQNSISLSQEESALLAFLNGPDNAGCVVASADLKIGYLSTVYTPLRSWRSHKYNTPFEAERSDELRGFFADGRVPLNWRGRNILLVASAGWTPPPGIVNHRVFFNKLHEVYRVRFDMPVGNG